MELDGYFVKAETMEALNGYIQGLEDTWGDGSLIKTLRSLIAQFEPVSGNNDTESELASRELHGVGMDLWGEDTSPKVDVAAKLKARLLTQKPKPKFII